MDLAGLRALLLTQDGRGALAWAALLAAAALGLALVGAPGRRRTLAATAAREAALVMALLGVWRLVGRVVRDRTEGAFDNARAVVAVQDALHLPSEAALQQAVIGQDWLIQASNLYYAGLHLPSMTLFLGWMWWRHRPQYAAARTTVVGVTLVSLVVQLVPVAPPRMFAEFVDTAAAHGQSVYGIGGSSVGSQLAAMPSVHVAWALLLAVYLTRLGGRWGRAIGVTHAVLTVWVVTVTANHWWLDGVVAAGLLAAVLAVQAAWTGRARRPIEPAPAALPAAPVVTLSR